MAALDAPQLVPDEGPPSEPFALTDQVWRKNPRKQKGFQPLPLQGKAAMLGMESELHRHLLHVNGTLQEDLDLLHQQVHQELRNAVSQELHAAARQIVKAVQDTEAARREAELLHTPIAQLSEETKWLRERLKQDTREAQKGALQVASKAAAEAKAAANAASAMALSAEAAQLRQESEEQHNRLRQELETKFQQLQEGQHAAQEAFRLELDSRTEQLSAELQAACSEQLKLAAEQLKLAAALEDDRQTTQENTHSLLDVREVLQRQDAVGEARFAETQVAVADLERRQAAALHSTATVLAERVNETQLRATEDLDAQVTARVNGLALNLEEKLEGTNQKLGSLGAQCNEQLALVQASTAQHVDWHADLHTEQFESDGPLEVISPVFAVAGLRGLQLRLRLRSLTEGGSPGGARRWACGVWLQGKDGRATFRLHVGGRSQMFQGADFKVAREWGAQRVAVIQGQLEQPIPVKLELLEVNTPVTFADASASTSKLSLRTSFIEPTEAAMRESSALRSSLVRKVEWRIARVSERLAIARTSLESVGNEEGPICSPPFAAAGAEGLQLQLYPLGYRSRNDDMCGLFLVCPKGMYVKCRISVGDAFRTFEHEFEAREPYGRGSLCRLSDKADRDDSVVCAVEFLEVRLAQSSQVRSGPFGSTADELKIIFNPAHGGMEPVRELRELPGGVAGSSGSVRAKVTKHRHPQQQPALTSDSTLRFPPERPSPGPVTLATSKSLPLLLPVVAGICSGPPGRRQADWRHGAAL